MVMTRKTKPPVALYSALADASRCRIVELLRDGPKPVHELADAFSISRPAISRHLRVLKTAGLVVEVKKGRENLYSVRLNKLDKAVEWVLALKGAETASEPVDAPAMEEASNVTLQTAAEPIAVAEPISVPEPVLTPVAKPVRKSKSSPSAAPEMALADDSVPPAVARAAREKAVTQMGFDF